MYASNTLDKKETHGIINFNCNCIVQFAMVKPANLECDMCISVCVSVCVIMNINWRVESHRSVIVYAIIMCHRKQQ